VLRKIIAELPKDTFLGRRVTLEVVAVFETFNGFFLFFGKRLRHINTDVDN
jgi:hypothetical protein